MKIFLYITVFSLLVISCTKEIIPENIFSSNLSQNLDLQPGVAITFDDNYYDEWIDMLPILDSYDAKVTFFISLNYPNNAKKEDKEKILRLYNNGNEIGCHTVNHPKTHIYLKTNSLTSYYLNEIEPSLKFFDMLGISVTSFAYPYGFNTSESDIFLSDYFLTIRTVSRYLKGDLYINVLDYDQKFIDGLDINLSGDSALNIYKKAIINAKKCDGVLVLIEHRPVKIADRKNKLTYAMLDSICNFVKQNNMRFYKIKDLSLKSESDSHK